ncbi:hypothetical protein KIW84_073895 [Lathyrus oleraceus]|uniref:Uncharacterized protein n=1 Tax=Pisum sativum TaxID=3888 RepID=A0A9D4VR72_PEA|nr:hypothetical protein KIW84_073895 [Pisum sativum]
MPRNNNAQEPQGNQAFVLESTSIKTTIPQGDAPRSPTCNQHRIHITPPPNPEGRSGSHSPSLEVIGPVARFVADAVRAFPVGRQFALSRVFLVSSEDQGADLELSFYDFRVMAAVGIEPPRTLNELLHKAQAYIRYEEKQVAHNARSGRNAGETEHSKREDTSISRRNGDKRREERPRELREGRGPAGRYSEYTLLTAPRERILAECINSEFKQGRVRFPKPSAPKPHTDKSKYCRFHRGHGHVTEDCVHLKDAIEILIQEGHLKQYTRKNEAPRHDEPEKKRPRENTPPDNSPYQVALCVSRPEDFFLPEPLPEGKITALSPWEDFPTTLVISGGGTNGESAALSVKRKFDELLLTAPEQKATLTKYRGKSNPISFFLEELPGGSPNSAIPLLIRAKMARFDVRRILVDEGSSVDIIPTMLRRRSKRTGRGQHEEQLQQQKTQDRGSCPRSQRHRPRLSHRAGRDRRGEVPQGTLSRTPGPTNPRRGVRTHSSWGRSGKDGEDR